jgi:uncharacterized membrane protein YfcA
MELLLAAIGLGIGALSGFFGIGGGTVLVPLLLLMGYEMKVAVGISIMQMVFSSIYGSYLNYRKGSLELGEGIFVGLGGFVGGYISGWLTETVPDSILQYTFIFFVLFALYRLLMAPEIHEDAENKTLPKGLLFAIGIGIGIVAISIGVGGAIILIPLLSGFLHYPIKKAVSAGLFFVVFSSVAGFLGRLMHGELDLTSGLIIGLASLVGVYIGVWLKDKVHAKKHKGFIVGMYLFILGIMAYKMFQQG